MNSSSRAFLQPTTLTMLSGFTIIVAATLALGSMVQDQSGQSAAMLSKSFRMELGATGVEFPLIPSGSEPSPDSATPRLSVSADPRKTFGQIKAFTDPVQEFAFMLSELERVAGHCTAETAMREVRLNWENAGTETVTSMINQACEILHEKDATLSGNSLQVEIQTWAASPTPAAWLDAIRHASHLRQAVHAELTATGQPDPLISSSAALWPYADRVRPAITIVFRFE